MKNALVILLLLCYNGLGFSQGEFIVQNKRKSDKIHFKFINNLIVIPVEINGVELSFLLDTGVSKPIIFNFLNLSDSLKIKDTERIYLRGLGEGESVEALKSKNNVFRVGDAVKFNQDLYAVFNADINFTPRLGVPVHGIIGYDLFKDLVVEISYSGKFIKLTEPEHYRYKNCRKCERSNLEFYNNKPYLNVSVKINNNEIPIKLLIDSGGSDSLWLFEDNDMGIQCGDKYFTDFLGHGLSGSVYGKRSRIQEFSIGNVVLKNANVAYPDSTSISYARQFKDRNGSLAGNILKRFNLIVDYPRGYITFKKNSYFNDPFSYNKSGIELAHDGMRFVKELDNVIRDDENSNLTDETHNGTKIVFDTRYKLSLKPAYTIVELREGSPADRAGLKIGDVILSINGKPSYHYTLQDLTHKFYDDEGTRIKLLVERYGRELTFEFRLEKLFE